MGLAPSTPITLTTHISPAMVQKLTQCPSYHEWLIEDKPPPHLSSMTCKTFQTFAKALDMRYFWKSVEAEGRNMQEQIKIYDKIISNLGLAGGGGGWREREKEKKEQEKYSVKVKRPKAFTCKRGAEEVTYYYGEDNSDPKDSKGGKCNTITSLYLEEDVSSKRSPYVLRSDKKEEERQGVQCNIDKAQNCDFLNLQEPELCHPCSTDSQTTYYPTKRLESLDYAFDKESEFHDIYNACFKALQSFHDNEMIHGDPHVQNFMVIPNTRRVVLIDFDTSFNLHPRADEEFFGQWKKRLQSVSKSKHLGERRQFNAQLVLVKSRHKK